MLTADLPLLKRSATSLPGKFTYCCGESTVWRLDAGELSVEAMNHSPQDLFYNTQEQSVTSISAGLMILRYSCIDWTNYPQPWQTDYFHYSSNLPLDIFIALIAVPREPPIQRHTPP